MEISDQTFDFPDDILIQILLKLPIRSVFKFRSVSKNWLSLISDHSFIPQFVSHSEDSPPFMLIFQMHCYKETLGFVCMGNVINKFASPFLCNQTEDLKIVATSNDLILYQSTYLEAVYYVANPFTRQRVRLPSLNRRRSLGCSKAGLMSYVRDGIASYNVVRVVKDHDSTSADAKLCLNIEILSSERDECRSFETRDCDFDGVEFDARPCIVFQGVLHWSCNRMTALLAYDPCSSCDQCRLTSIPNEAYMSGMNANLGTSCGELYYFEMGGISIEGGKLPGWKLWLMRDYTRGEWRLDQEGKQRKIECLGVVSNVLSTYSRLLPIALHPWKKDVVYFWYEGYVLTFDTRKGWFEEKLSTFSSSAGVVSTWEIFPLLMPLCPTQVPEP